MSAAFKSFILTMLIWMLSVAPVASQQHRTIHPQATDCSIVGMSCEALYLQSDLYQVPLTIQRVTSLSPDMPMAAFLTDEGVLDFTGSWDYDVFYGYHEVFDFDPPTRWVTSRIDTTYQYRAFLGTSNYGSFQTESLLVFLLKQDVLYIFFAVGNAGNVAQYVEDIAHGRKQYPTLPENYSPVEVP